MRSIDSSKQGGTLQGERVVQTGREVVPLLPWGSTSPYLNQYLSKMEESTKKYANNYAITFRQVTLPDLCWLSKSFCDFGPYPHSTGLKRRYTGRLRRVRVKGLNLTWTSLQPHFTLTDACVQSFSSLKKLADESTMFRDEQTEWGWSEVWVRLEWGWTVPTSLALSPLYKGVWGDRVRLWGWFWKIVPRPRIELGTKL